jgi:hypothetical protein
MARKKNNTEPNGITSFPESPPNGITSFSEAEQNAFSKLSKSEQQTIKKLIDLQEMPFTTQGLPTLGSGDLMGIGPSSPAAPANLNYFAEYGTTGLMYIPPYVYEEWLTELQYTRGVRMYKEMYMMDAVISSIFYAVEMSCRSVNLWWETDGETPEDLKALTFYEQCWEDMSVNPNDLLSEILSMFIFGYHLAEIVYKKREGPHPEDATLDSNYDDGRIGWRKFATRAQETLLNWDFDVNGGIRGFRQLAPPHFRITEIPIEKLLLFRVKPRKGNPEGVSLLRGAYRTYMFKKLAEEIMMTGLERDLAGVPILRAPGEVLTGIDARSVAMNNMLKRVVRNLKRNQDEGILLPSNNYPADMGGGPMYSLELAGPQSQRQFDIVSIIQMFSKWIAMTVLADFLMLGQDTTGSYALAETRNNLFSISISAILDSICQVFNSYAVPRLAQLNPDINPESLPKLVHGDVASAEINDVGTFLNNVARGGVPIPDDVTFRNALWDLVHLPKEPEPEGETATPVDSLLPGQTAARARERSQPINEETPYRGTPPRGFPSTYSQLGADVAAKKTQKSQPSVGDVHVNKPSEEFSVAYVQGTQPKKKKKKRSNAS